MKTRMQNTLGMQVPFMVPATVIEFAAAGNVGEDGAEDFVLGYATDEAIFRTILPNFRSAFFEAFEKETGNERQVTKTVTKKVDGEDKEVPVYEKDTEYFRRALEELGKEPSDFNGLAAEVAKEISFDLTAKPRAGKVAKEYVNRAAKIADLVNGGSTDWDTVLSKLESLNPGISIARTDDGSPDMDELARALKVDTDRRSNEQLGSLV